MLALPARRNVVVTGFLLFLSSAPTATAETLNVRWEELAPLIAKREISLALPNGFLPRGRVLDITGEKLILDVRGREPLSIGRRFISVIRIEPPDGKRRILGTVIGALAGAAAAVAILRMGHDSGSPASIAAAAAAPVAGAVSGFLVGRRTDRNAMYLVVERDATPPPPATGTRQ